MRRSLFWIMAMLVMLGTLAACPAVKEQEGPVIESPGRRPSYEKVTLRLKLGPAERYEMAANSRADMTVKLEPPAPEGEAAEMQVTHSTVATALQSEVTAAQREESGMLARAERVLSFAMEETTTEGEISEHRSLSMGKGGVKLVVDDEKAPLEQQDEALVSALRKEFLSLVDERGQVERIGDSWDQLKEAKSASVFPYVDWERMLEAAMILPEEEEISVGKSWEHDAALPLGDGSLAVHFIWTLKEVAGEDDAKLAQIGVQVSGKASEGLHLAGKAKGAGYDTQVENLTVTGTYNLVFDLAQGNYRNVNGDLNVRMTLLVTTKADGQPQVTRVTLDDGRMTMDAEVLPQEKEPADELAVQETVDEAAPEEKQPESSAGEIAAGD